MSILTEGYCPYDGTKLSPEIVTKDRTTFYPCRDCRAMWDLDFATGYFILLGYDNVRKK